MVREAKPLQNNFFPLSFEGEGDLEGEVSQYLLSGEEVSLMY
jgi:hypothetical protein